MQSTNRLWLNSFQHQVSTLKLTNYLPCFIVRHVSSSGKGAKKEEQNSQAVIHKSYFYPNTEVGIKERSVKAQGTPDAPIQTPYPPFPHGKNPKTGEEGGPTGPEPTRFGDWERKGRVSDF